MAQIDTEAFARSPWLAGALGAIVALHSVPGASWLERLCNVFCGLLIAGFLSPAVAQYIGQTTPEMLSATAFVCGLFGLNVCSAVVVWIKGANIGDLLPWKR